MALRDPALVLAVAAVVTFVGACSEPDRAALEYAKVERFGVQVAQRDGFRLIERFYWLNVKVPTEEVIAHYDEELRRNGWTQRYAREHEQYGQMTCYEKDALRAEVVAWTESGRPATRYWLSISDRRGGCEASTWPNFVLPN